MGDRRYSLEMARLLDPQGEYFKDEVISRDDATEMKQKDLNCHTLILDLKILIQISFLFSDTFQFTVFYSAVF